VPVAALLFDWDLTLVDNWDAIHASWNAALGYADLPIIDRATSKEYGKLALKESFPKIFGDQADAASRIFYQHFEQCHLEYLTPMPGAEEFLRHLPESLPRAIISNKQHGLLQKEVRALRWEQYFHHIQGAVPDMPGKPAGAPILKVLARLDCQPSADCWLIGDSDADSEAALNAGISALGFSEQGQFATRLQNWQQGIAWFKKMHEH